MLAAATYKRGETDPTVMLVAYRKGYAAGESDDRLQGNADFRGVRVRQFSPGSGCALTIEHGKIIAAEPGLQGFIGKNITEYGNTSGVGWAMTLVVWRGEPMAYAGIGKEDFAVLLRKFRGLADTLF